MAQELDYIHNINSKQLEDYQVIVTILKDHTTVTGYLSNEEIPISMGMNLEGINTVGGLIENAIRGTVEAVTEKIGKS